MLDRGAMRRAFRGCDVVFHTAGCVASRPAERSGRSTRSRRGSPSRRPRPRSVRRVVVTSSVAGIGPAPRGPARHRGGRLPRLGARADLPRRQARGRVGGAGRRRPAGGRGGGREPVVRVRRARRPLAAGRDLDAHDRQLPARPAAGGGGRRDERRRRARRGQGAPARRRARPAGRALRARRARRRAGWSCSSAWPSCRASTTRSSCCRRRRRARARGRGARAAGLVSAEGSC